MRCAIYARYSSDNQREASIEDQLEVCRRYVAGQGWTEESVYEDRAQSGASRFRVGYQRLLADAQAGTFDLVVCEALDRLGRKLADVADLFDRLSFLGIELHTVSTGRITPMHVGMLGTMAQMYLADLREKTWRGQLGRALKGRPGLRLRCRCTQCRRYGFPLGGRANVYFPNCESKDIGARKVAGWASRLRWVFWS